MSDFAKRGLGRGLSALLGEPVRTETPPANAPKFNTQPQQPAPQPRAPIEPPRNVFELPTTSAPPQQTQAPQSTAAPKNTAGEAGHRSVPIDLVQRNPSQPRKHFDESELN